MLEWCRYALTHFQMVVHTLPTSLQQGLRNNKYEVAPADRILVCGVCGDYNALSVPDKRTRLLLLRSWSLGLHDCDLSTVLQLDDLDSTITPHNNSTNGVYLADICTAVGETTRLLVLCEGKVPDLDQHTVSGNIFTVRSASSACALYFFLKLAVLHFLADEQYSTRALAVLGD